MKSSYYNPFELDLLMFELTMSMENYSTNFLMYSNWDILRSRFMESPSFRYFRLPKIGVKIHNLVIDHFNPFAFEQLLHQIRSVKMMFSRKQSFSVDHSVCRNIFQMMTGIHRPADHPGGARHSQCFRNSAIRSDLAVRNLSGDSIDFFEKIVGWIWHFATNSI